MSIKLCLLKTGETVIGDVKEVIDPAKNETLGFKISAPYVIDYQYQKVLNVEDVNLEVNETEKNTDSQINFRFWAPLSSERDFKFPHEFVEVIYEPHKSIVESYISILEHWQKENTVEVVIDTNETVVTMNPEKTPELLAQSEEEN